MILDIDLKIDVFFVSAKRRNGFPGHVRRDITGLAHRSENLRTEKRLYRYRKNEGKSYIRFDDYK